MHSNAPKDLPFTGRDPIYHGVHNSIPWCIYQAQINGVLNGYARIPDGHTIDVDGLDVHGGITYGSGECEGWIGFDTAHAGDLWDLDELRCRVGVHVTPSGVAWHAQEASLRSGRSWERTWTVDALKAEVFRLCDQIAAASTKAGA
ncbi:hypothetical protein JTZ10_21580 [Gordonia rubripertincta]|uniref:Uncharacterized protein n=1 Tax=Gordonia rubripertincta TaxID=36822 RepID=A0AAW4GAH9_GORRU|nr:hypothetical protein [Gordonia rubripertincta]MBM7280339.1 hypothetical protein [Gordonia rubripertincta]